jgi:hypothetical protein
MDLSGPGIDVKLKERKKECLSNAPESLIVLTALLAGPNMAKRESIAS